MNCLSCDYFWQPEEAPCGDDVADGQQYVGPDGRTWTIYKEGHSWWATDGRHVKRLVEEPRFSAGELVCYPLSSPKR